MDRQERHSTSSQENFVVLAQWQKEDEDGNEDVPIEAWPSQHRPPYQGTGTRNHSQGSDSDELSGTDEYNLFLSQDSGLTRIVHVEEARDVCARSDDEHDVASSLLQLSQSGTTFSRIPIPKDDISPPTTPSRDTRKTPPVSEHSRSSDSSSSSNSGQKTDPTAKKEIIIFSDTRYEYKDDGSRIKVARSKPGDGSNPASQESSYSGTPGHRRRSLKPLFTAESKATYKSAVAADTPPKKSPVVEPEDSAEGTYLAEYRHKLYGKAYFTMSPPKVTCSHSSSSVPDDLPATQSTHEDTTSPVLQQYEDELDDSPLDLTKSSASLDSQENVEAKAGHEDQSSDTVVPAVTEETRNDEYADANDDSAPAAVPEETLVEKESEREEPEVNASIADSYTGMPEERGQDDKPTSDDKENEGDQSETKDAGVKVASGDLTEAAKNLKITEPEEPEETKEPQETQELQEKVMDVVKDQPTSTREVSDDKDDQVAPSSERDDQPSPKNSTLDQEDGSEEVTVSSPQISVGDYKQKTKSPMVVSPSGAVEEDDRKSDVDESCIDVPSTEIADSDKPVEAEMVSSPEESLPTIEDDGESGETSADVVNLNQEDKNEEAVMSEGDASSKEVEMSPAVEESKEAEIDVISSPDGQLSKDSNLVPVEEPDSGSAEIIHETVTTNTDEKESEETQGVEDEPKVLEEATSDSGMTASHQIIQDSVSTDVDLQEAVSEPETAEDGFCDVPESQSHTENTEVRDVPYQSEGDVSEGITYHESPAPVSVADEVPVECTKSPEKEPAAEESTEIIPPPHVEESMVGDEQSHAPAAPLQEEDQEKTEILPKASSEVVSVVERLQSEESQSSVDGSYVPSVSSPTCGQKSESSVTADQVMPVSEDSVSLQEESSEVTSSDHNDKDVDESSITGRGDKNVFVSDQELISQARSSQSPVATEVCKSSEETLAPERMAVIEASKPKTEMRPDFVDHSTRVPADQAVPPHPVQQQYPNLRSKLSGDLQPAVTVQHQSTVQEYPEARQAPPEPYHQETAAMSAVYAQPQSVERQPEPEPTYHTDILQSAMEGANIGPDDGLQPELSGPPPMQYQPGTSYVPMTAASNQTYYQSYPHHGMHHVNMYQVQQLQPAVMVRQPVTPPSHHQMMMYMPENQQYGNVPQPRMHYPEVHVSAHQYQSYPSQMAVNQYQGLQSGPTRMQQVQTNIAPHQGMQSSSSYSSSMPQNVTSRFPQLSSALSSRKQHMIQHPERSAMLHDRNSFQTGQFQNVPMSGQDPRLPSADTPSQNILLPSGELGQSPARSVGHPYQPGGPTGMQPHIAQQFPTRSSLRTADSPMSPVSPAAAASPQMSPGGSTMMSPAYYAQTTELARSSLMTMNMPSPAQASELPPNTQPAFTPTPTTASYNDCAQLTDNVKNSPVVDFSKQKETNVGAVLSPPNLLLSTASSEAAKEIQPKSTTVSHPQQDSSMYDMPTLTDFSFTAPTVGSGRNSNVSEPADQAISPGTGNSLKSADSTGQESSVQESDFAEEDISSHGDENLTDSQNDTLEPAVCNQAAVKGDKDSDHVNANTDTQSEKPSEVAEKVEEESSVLEFASVKSATVNKDTDNDNSKDASEKPDDKLVESTQAKDDLPFGDMCNKDIVDVVIETDSDGLYVAPFKDDRTFDVPRSPLSPHEVNHSRVTRQPSEVNSSPSRSDPMSPMGSPDKPSYREISNIARLDSDDVSHTSEDATTTPRRASSETKSTDVDEPDMTPKGNETSDDDGQLTSVKSTEDVDSQEKDVSKAKITDVELKGSDDKEETGKSVSNENDGKVNEETMEPASTPQLDDLPETEEIVQTIVNIAKSNMLLAGALQKGDSQTKKAFDPTESKPVEPAEVETVSDSSKPDEDETEPPRNVLDETAQQTEAMDDVASNQACNKTSHAETDSDDHTDSDVQAVPEEDNNEQAAIKQTTGSDDEDTSPIKGDKDKSAFMQSLNLRTGSEKAGHTEGEHEPSKENGFPPVESSLASESFREETVARKRKRAPLLESEFNTDLPVKRRNRTVRDYKLLLAMGKSYLDIQHTRKVRPSVTHKSSSDDRKTFKIQELCPLPKMYDPVVTLVDCNSLMALYNDETSSASPQHIEETQFRQKSLMKKKSSWKEQARAKERLKRRQKHDPEPAGSEANESEKMDVYKLTDDEFDEQQGGEEDNNPRNVAHRLRNISHTQPSRITRSTSNEYSVTQQQGNKLTIRRRSSLMGELPSPVQSKPRRLKSTGGNETVAPSVPDVTDGQDEVADIPDEQCKAEPTVEPLPDNNGVSEDQAQPVAQAQSVIEAQPVAPLETKITRKRGRPRKKRRGGFKGRISGVQSDTSSGVSTSGTDMNKTESDAQAVGQDHSACVKESSQADSNEQVDTKPDGLPDGLPKDLEGQSSKSEKHNEKTVDERNEDPTGSAQEHDSESDKFPPDSAEKCDSESGAVPTESAEKCDSESGAVPPESTGKHDSEDGEVPPSNQDGPDENSSRLSTEHSMSGSDQKKVTSEEKPVESVDQECKTTSLSETVSDAPVENESVNPLVTPENEVTEPAVEPCGQSAVSDSLEHMLSDVPGPMDPPEVNETRNKSGRVSLRSDIVHHRSESDKKQSEENPDHQVSHKYKVSQGILALKKRYKTRIPKNYAIYKRAIAEAKSKVIVTLKRKNVPNMLKPIAKYIKRQRLLRDKREKDEAEKTNQSSLPPVLSYFDDYPGPSSFSSFSAELLKNIEEENQAAITLDFDVSSSSYTLKGTAYDDLPLLSPPGEPNVCEASEIPRLSPVAKILEKGKRRGRPPYRSEKVKAGMIDGKTGKKGKASQKSQKGTKRQRRTSKFKAADIRQILTYYQAKVVVARRPWTVQKLNEIESNHKKFILPCSVDICKFQLKGKSITIKLPCPTIKASQINRVKRIIRDLKLNIILDSDIRGQLPLKQVKKGRGRPRKKPQMKVKSPVAADLSSPPVKKVVHAQEESTSKEDNSHKTSEENDSLPGPSACQNDDKAKDETGGNAALETPSEEVPAMTELTSQSAENVTESAPSKNSPLAKESSEVSKQSPLAKELSNVGKKASQCSKSAPKPVPPKDKQGNKEVNKGVGDHGGLEKASPPAASLISRKVSKENTCTGRVPHTRPVFTKPTTIMIPRKGPETSGVRDSMQAQCSGEAEDSKHKVLQGDAGVKVRTFGMPRTHWPLAKRASAMPPNFAPRGHYRYMYQRTKPLSSAMINYSRGPYMSPVTSRTADEVTKKPKYGPTMHDEYDFDANDTRTSPMARVISPVARLKSTALDIPVSWDTPLIVEDPASKRANRISPVARQVRISPPAQVLPMPDEWKDKSAIEIMMEKKELMQKAATRETDSSSSNSPTAKTVSTKNAQAKRKDSAAEDELHEGDAKNGKPTPILKKTKPILKKDNRPQERNIFEKFLSLKADSSPRSKEKKVKIVLPEQASDAGASKVFEGSLIKRAKLLVPTKLKPVEAPNKVPDVNTSDALQGNAPDAVTTRATDNADVVQLPIESVLPTTEEPPRLQPDLVMPSPSQPTAAPYEIPPVRGKKRGRPRGSRNRARTDIPTPVNNDKYFELFSTDYEHQPRPPTKDLWTEVKQFSSISSTARKIKTEKSESKDKDVKDKEKEEKESSKYRTYSKKDRLEKRPDFWFLGDAPEDVIENEESNEEGESLKLLSFSQFEEDSSQSHEPRSSDSEDAEDISTRKRVHSPEKVPRTPKSVDWGTLVKKHGESSSEHSASSSAEHITMEIYPTLAQSGSKRRRSADDVEHGDPKSHMKSANSSDSGEEKSSQRIKSTEGDDLQKWKNLSRLDEKVRALKEVIQVQEEEIRKWQQEKEKTSENVETGTVGKEEMEVDPVVQEVSEDMVDKGRPQNSDLPEGENGDSESRTLLTTETSDLASVENSFKQPAESNKPPVKNIKNPSESTEQPMEFDEKPMKSDERPAEKVEQPTGTSSSGKGVKSKPSTSSQNTSKDTGAALEPGNDAVDAKVASVVKTPVPCPESGGQKDIKDDGKTNNPQVNLSATEPPESKDYEKDAQDENVPSGSIESQDEDKAVAGFGIPPSGNLAEVEHNVEENKRNSSLTDVTVPVQRESESDGKPSTEKITLSQDNILPAVAEPQSGNLADVEDNLDESKTSSPQVDLPTPKISEQLHASDEKADTVERQGGVEKQDKVCEEETAPQSLGDVCGETTSVQGTDVKEKSDLVSKGEIATDSEAMADVEDNAE